MQTIAKNTLLIVHKGKFYPAKFQVIAKKEPSKPLERWYLEISLAFLSSRTTSVGVTKRQELSTYEQQKPRRKLMNGVFIVKLRGTFISVRVDLISSLKPQWPNLGGWSPFTFIRLRWCLWYSRLEPVLCSCVSLLAPFYYLSGRSCISSWGLRWILALCCSLSAASRAVVMKFSFKLSSVTISSGL